ncbi:HAD hydrolase-like protein [Herbaspirillum sp. GCM10030257]|uniref:HAD hydrolase-like protein n=1 Tax=Herbaspirillum sp. GCM10030257 TaxID=3273393 RepID=UPI00360BEB99
MGIDLLIFGLDGVMFDTDEAQVNACNDAFAHCGIAFRWTTAQYREAARAHGAFNAISAIIGGIVPSLTNRQFDELVCEKNRLLHQYVLAGMAKPHQACVSLASEAHASGCKLAVVTDMPARTTTVLLEQSFGNTVTDMFAAVVSGAVFNDAAGNGPHHLAMRTVGVDGSHSAAIDTTAPALHAAQAAGIWTIAATPYAKDVARIAGADLWCPQLQELRDLIGRKQTPRERSKHFVTFDSLRVLKKNQLDGLPVLRPTLPIRSNA